MKVLKIDSIRLKSLATIGGLITALLIVAMPFSAFAASSILVNRSGLISDSTVGAVTSHTFNFTMANTSQMVGSISFEFCSNSPLPNTSCIAPVGFDAGSVVLTAQGGDVGFSMHPASNSNRIVITRPPLNPTAVPSGYQFDNIVNPSSAGSYYVRLQTYTSTDGTGIDIENGGTVFVITSGLNVNAEVPPYIRFCAGVTIVSFDCSTATSFFIDFGELSTTTTRKASSQFVVATNAQSGYTVSVSGTTLISGSNIIPALASPTAPTVGVSEFGINLRSNTNPAVGDDVVGPGTSNADVGYNTPNLYKFVNGDTLVTVGNSNSNRKFTVSYITNINASQAAGVYATTVSYICLANF